MNMNSGQFHTYKSLFPVRRTQTTSNDKRSTSINCPIKSIPTGIDLNWRFIIQSTQIEWVKLFDGKNNERSMGMVKHAGVTSLRERKTAKDKNGNPQGV